MNTTGWGEVDSRTAVQCMHAISQMRDWLIVAGSAVNNYEGYTAEEVIEAIDCMYPGGVVGWFCNADLRGVSR